MNPRKKSSAAIWSVVFAIIPTAGVSSLFLLLMIPVWSGQVSGEGGLGVMLGLGTILYFGSHTLLATSLAGMALGVSAIFKTGWQRGVTGLLLNLAVLVISGAYLSTVYHHKSVNPDNLPRAARQGDKRKVEKLLVRGFDINYHLGNGTALTHAATGGHLEIVKLLLAHGADITIGNPVGAAAATGHETIVKLLLEQGGSPNCLDAALRGKNINILRILLAHGANVNQKVDSSGRTPLQAAVETGQEEFVKLLLTRDADVNATNDNGETPLHVLARMWPQDYWPKDFRVTAINLLLDAGADIEAKTKRGKTPLWLAAEVSHSADAIRVLLQRGADLANIQDMHVRFAAVPASMPKMELTQWVRANAADVHARNSRGESLLHAAVTGANMPLVEILFTAGVDVNAKTNTGDTPLHWAMNKFQPQMVALLTSNEADVNARNRTGSTPLHMVATSINIGNEKLLEPDRRNTVEILLENDAQVDIADNKGMTPLDRLERWRPQSSAGISYQNELMVLLRKYQK